MKVLNVYSRNRVGILASIILSTLLIVLLCTFLTTSSEARAQSKQNKEPVQEPVPWITSKVVSGVHPDTDGERIVFTRFDLTYAYSQSQSSCAGLAPRAPRVLYTDYDICGYDIGASDFFTVVNDDASMFIPQIHGDWVVYLGYVFTAGRGVFAQNLVSGVNVRVYNGENGGDITDMAFDGSTIAFDDIGNESLFFIHDLESGEQISLPLRVPALDVYSGTVVMQHETGIDQESNILGYDLDTGQIFTISARLGREERPRIHGDLVVWEWYNNIYGRDLRTGDAYTFTRFGGASHPDVSAEWIVWRENRWDRPARLIAANRHTGQHTTVVDGLPQATVPRLGGHVITWDAEGDVYMAHPVADSHFLPLILHR